MTSSRATWKGRGKVRFTEKLEKRRAAAKGKPPGYRMPEHCRKGNHGRPCVYRGFAGGVPVCEYGLITGESRAYHGVAAGKPQGCSLEDCTHYLDEEPRAYSTEGVSVTQGPTAAEKVPAPKRQKVYYRPPGTSEAQRNKLQARRDRMRLMYEHGMSDREIAACMAASIETVAHWRRCEGLAPQNRNRPQMNDVRRLWEKGLYDKDIAAELRCSQSAVQRVRTGMGLVANAKRKGVQNDG